MYPLVILDVLKHPLVVPDVLKHPVSMRGTETYQPVFGHGRNLFKNNGTHHGSLQVYTIVTYHTAFCLTTRKAVSNIHNLLRTGGETLLVFLGKCPVFKAYEIQSRKPEWQSYMKVRIFHVLHLCS
jgi:hypothetical protein